MASADRELDALVIGAGIAGLYMLHQLREQGLRVRAYDAADDIGGTWWWHGYPGSRVDTECYLYQYLFSEQLYAEWSWSERFPAGYEVLRWLRFLVDRLDLQRDIQLSARIVSAHYDEDRGRWTLRTDRGEAIDTRFVISCAGTDGPGTDVIEGQDSFAGTILATSCWPEKGPDLTGRRVGVVGVDATGIQLIPKIVERVGHLTVFAGAPQYVLPMANPAYGWQDREAYKARYREFRRTVPYTASGFDEDLAPVRGDPALLEELYRDGSLRLWRATVGASSADRDTVSEFVRAKMRERLADDPRLVDLLVPTDRFGDRRVPLDTGYLEVYHRDDVDLVGVRDTPIRRVRPEGIERTDGTVHALDVIVLATGSDAGPGALRHIDVRGRGGRSLAQEWDADVRTTLGLAKHGHPNLFIAGAPLAPSAARHNTTPHLQQQTEWIAAAIRDLRTEGRSTMEPTAAGEDAWVAHHDRSAGTPPIAGTLAWSADPDVAAPTRRPLTSAGGVGAHRRACEEEAAAGYPGFLRT